MHVLIFSYAKMHCSVVLLIHFSSLLATPLNKKRYFFLFVSRLLFFVVSLKALYFQPVILFFCF